MLQTNRCPEKVNDFELVELLVTDLLRKLSSFSAKCISVSPRGFSPLCPRPEKHYTGWDPAENRWCSPITKLREGLKETAYPVVSGMLGTTRDSRVPRESNPRTVSSIKPQKRVSLGGAASTRE